jgi:hypothetical protein
MGRYWRHGPTASRYWRAITRSICARWPRSCTTHAASNCPSVTWPSAGCMPVRASMLGWSFSADNPVRLCFRSAANVPNRSWTDFPAIRSSKPTRSNGSNGLASPSSSMIRILGSQSTCSPYIKWPRTSMGLNVCGPSRASNQACGIPLSNPAKAAGVRAKSAFASSKWTSMIQIVASPPGAKIGTCGHF